MSFALARPLAALSLILAASMAFVACTGDEDADPSPIVPTATITLTASPQPSETTTVVEGEVRETGDAALDAIVRAVAERDITTLAGLLEYPVLQCTTADGLGGPPKCEDGLREGDEVRMFPYGACEGAWTRFGAETIAQFAQRTAGLWGVLHVDRYWDVTDGWEAPDTFLAFHFETPADYNVAYLEVKEGRIVRAVFACGGTLDDLLAVSSMQLSLIAGPWDDPIAPPPPAVPSTGIAAVDGVLGDVARYDVAALSERAAAAMADLPPVGCEEEPLEGPGGVPCDPKNGEVEGDLISVFPIAYCEGALVRDPRDAMRGFLNSAPVLYAVVEAPSEPSQSDLYRHGTYWIVYEQTNLDGVIETGTRLHVTADGAITALWYGCLPPIEELVQWSGAELPPIEVREE